MFVVYRFPEKHIFISDSEYKNSLFRIQIFEFYSIEVILIYMDNLENFAFIDGQNLFLGTTKSDNPWSIDLYKFRVYLKEKYSVKKAFYFLGIIDESHNNLYETIQDAGFILIFREHNVKLTSKKKGNIDTDLVFNVMEKMYYKDISGGVVLVAGDGDYRLLVDFLIKENKFKKILFPNQKRASSLYKKINIKFKADLSCTDVKRKIKREK